MNRIEKKLSDLKKQQEKALITYVTAGYPEIDFTKEVVKIQEKAGTDIIELGIPFSDPVADGPVIQDASYQAINNGTTLKKIFKCVEEMRGEGVDIPLVFMLYYNSILFYGIENFVEECIRTGVDGLIVPDLPFEEQDALREGLSGQENTILLQLVSPVSKERIPEIVKDAKGFIYCVSSMGVTGQKAQFHKEIKTYLDKVVKEADIPVMLGFGIRTAKDVTPFVDYMDGFIVGSYFIQLIKENNFDLTVVFDYVRSFKKNLKSLIEN